MQIPNGVDSGTAVGTAAVVEGDDKFCGRFLSATAGGATADATICCKLNMYFIMLNPSVVWNFLHSMYDNSIFCKQRENTFFTI